MKNLKGETINLCPTNKKDCINLKHNFRIERYYYKEDFEKCKKCKEFFNVVNFNNKIKNH